MINSKNKGSSFEREIRDTLKHLDPSVRRSLGSGAFGSFLESDKSDIATNLPISIECKRTEKLKPYEFYEQCRTAATGIKVPVVVMRSSNKPALALIEWQDFLSILGSAISNGFIGRQKLAKPSRSSGKRLTLEETASLPFSKVKQLRK